MSLKSKSSIFDWAAAVTVPLVVLAFVAALGIRGQKEAARTRAQDEAAVISASQAEPFSRKLLAGIEEFPRFPDPPAPGGKSSFDDQLDGSDVRELAMLRDNPDAGISPAGMPRRALATLRIDALFPQEQEMTELVDLLTREAPRC